MIENQYRKINYKLCTSIDLISLGVVLETMEKEGILTTQERRTFEIQASALLTAIRNANEKAFGSSQHFPIL